MEKNREKDYEYMLYYGTKPRSLVRWLEIKKLMLETN